MSLKEIEKLREKVEKDPNSRLFVPLAEEYRKEGMLEDAVDILLKGIENQPGYMSARVSLGKIYLEKGMPAEARAEFESVVRSIPDNLYAQKKLAEIYRDMGERELAVKSYRIVLKLNAMDEEAISTLKSLEDIEDEQQAAAAGTPEMTGTAYPAGTLEAPAELPHAEEPAEQEATVAGTDDDLRAFKDSLFGTEAAAEGAGAEMETGPDIGDDDALEVIEEEAEEPGSEVSLEEVNAVLDSDVRAVEVDVAESGEAPEEELTQAEEGAAPEEDIPVGTASFFEETAPKKKGPTLEEAERRISEGNYAGAVNIYRNILALHPGDNRTLQRLEELKVLLKLLGKDKEVLMARLDAFLKGIEKRHDEFLGRP